MDHLLSVFGLSSACQSENSSDGLVVLDPMSKALPWEGTRLTGLNLKIEIFGLNQQVGPIV